MTKPVENIPNRREYYRITYPALSPTRPVLTIDGDAENKTRVINVSETGLRIQLSGKKCLEIGAEIHGTIQFHSKKLQEVRGTVLYQVDDFVAVKLKRPGIPMRLIFEEQRMLLKLYPDRYSLELH